MTTAMAKPRKLPKLNRARIAQEEQAAIQRELRGARLPETRLKKASAILAAADAEIERDRPTRDEAGLSLALFDGIRAVNDVIGVHRSHFYGMRSRALRLTDEEKAAHWLEESAPGVRRSKEEIRARAAACGVAQVEHAGALAVRYGEGVARATERAAAARVFRDTAVVELSTKNGWARGRIAVIAGIDESRVSQIVGEAGTS